MRAQWRKLDYPSRDFQCAFGRVPLGFSSRYRALRPQFTKEAKAEYAKATIHCIFKSDLFVASWKPSLRSLTSSICISARGDGLYGVQRWDDQLLPFNGCCSRTKIYILNRLHYSWVHFSLFWRREHSKFDFRAGAGDSYGIVGGSSGAPIFFEEGPVNNISCCDASDSSVDFSTNLRVASLRLPTQMRTFLHPFEA